MSLLLKLPRKNINRIGILAYNSGNANHCFFINKNKNIIWGWGINANTRIGDNTATDRYSPVLVAQYGLKKTFDKISAGVNHSLAVDAKGRLWGWGDSAANATGSQKCFPAPVLGAVKTFCEITAGNSFSLAIDKNGRAWGWGNNNFGQVGDNSINNKTTPVSLLGAIKTFCKIAAGRFHSVAIDKNGRLWGWGYNRFGQNGSASTISKRTPVSVGGAIKTFCQISAGSDFTLGLDKNGQVWGWGYGFQGQIGNGTFAASVVTPSALAGTLRTFCKIAAGASFSLAIDKNGRVWSWGFNGGGQLAAGTGGPICRNTAVLIAGAAKTFCQIVAGLRNGWALDKYGKVWTWGEDGLGVSITGASRRFEASPVSVKGAIKTFCEISAGNGNSIAIAKNGRVWGWGNNLGGVIGDNSQLCRCTPVSVVGAVKTFCKIVAGNSHSLGIDKNGRVWGWGQNGNGQLGDNTNTIRFTPVSVAGAIKTFCEISAGNAFSIGIDKNGRLWGWGSNNVGQLGDNSTTQRITPTSILGAVKTFCKISTGSSFTLAIDKNGRAWGWGTNQTGGLGDNSTISKLTPVSIGGQVKTFCKISGGDFFSLAIDKNGKVWGWGSSNNCQLADGTTLSEHSPIVIGGALKTFCHISAGASFSLAINKDGRAWAWGYNGVGNLGDNSTINRFTPVSVAGAVKTFCKITAGAATGSSFSLAIDKNGRLWSWGNGFNGQLGINSTTSQRTPVSVLGQVKTFCEISNGPNQAFALAIDKNGRVWGWGVNGNGQIGDNTATSRRTPVSVVGAVKTFCKISVGGFHSLAIDKNGRLWAWGNNSNGQLGNNSTTSRATPISVLGAIKTFCHIAGGNSQSSALDKNGQAWGWGFNGSGQNGDGESYDNWTPVDVKGQKKTFCKIASGNGPTFAIDNYGLLWAWGFNGNAQLGDGSTIAKRTPVRVSNNKTFCEVRAAENHVLATEKNGNVWAWGNNLSGQLANPYRASVLTPVSIIGQTKTFCEISTSKCNHSLALDKYGKAWVWGRNNSQQLGINKEIDYIRSPFPVYGNKTFCKISTYVDFSVAIDKNGRVWGWGINNLNQLGAASALVYSATTPVRICDI
jgi:alpha-tubulin suppressor-like RCC1 family protein